MRKIYSIFKKLSKLEWTHSSELSNKCGSERCISGFKSHSQSDS